MNKISQSFTKPVFIMSTSKRKRKQVARSKKEVRNFMTIVVVATLILLVLLYFIYAKV